LAQNLAFYLIMNNTINLVCIIDDDPIYTFAVKKLMKMNAFSEQFLIFKNGKEALDGLTNLHKNKSTFPDLILLDINMPIMDGWQFLDACKNISLDISSPLYMTSSSIDEKDKKKSKTYDMITEYVEKPLTLDSLNKLVNQKN